MAVVVVNVACHAGTSPADLPEALSWELLLLERATKAREPPRGGSALCLLCTRVMPVYVCEGRGHRHACADARAWEAGRGGCRKPQEVKLGPFSGTSGSPAKRDPLSVLQRGTARRTNQTPARAAPGAPPRCAQAGSTPVLLYNAREAPAAPEADGAGAWDARLAGAVRQLEAVLNPTGGVLSSTTCLADAASSGQLADLVQVRSLGI